MKSKKLLSILVAGAMAFSCISTVATAQTSNPDGVQADQLGKTAERVAADEWQVQLSLPALEVRPSADVVIVMDVSSSMSETDVAEAKAAANAMCDELASKNNVDIRVGVVTFDRDATVVSELSSDLGGVKAKIDGITSSSDTNMMAGLMAGKAMLDESTAGDQYLVLMSDGIPICWMEDGQVSNKTIYQLQNDGSVSTSFQAGNEINQGNAANSRPIDSAADLLSIEELLANGDAIEADSDNIYMNLNTGAYMEKDGDGGAYYTNLETATYHTAKFIQDNLAGDKAHLITVAYGTDKNPGVTHYDYARTFCAWIGEQSDSYYEVSKVGFGGEEGDLTNVFSDIANETIKLIDKGVVTDVIGTDFDLNTANAVPFTLTKGVGEDAVTYEGAALGNGSYGFAPNGDGYDYVVTYEAQEDGTETVVWNINVPVTKDQPVALTYNVVLADSVRNEGTHTNLSGMRNTLDEEPSFVYTEPTNESAVLDSTDSLGNVTADDLAFPVPNASFEVGVLTVEHTYAEGVTGDPLTLPEKYTSLPVITDWSEGYTAQFSDAQNLASLANDQYVLTGITVVLPDGTTQTYETEQAFQDAMLNANGFLNAQTGLTQVTYNYAAQTTGGGDVPDTSDGSNLFAWGAMMAVAGGAALVLIRKRKEA